MCIFEVNREFSGDGDSKNGVGWGWSSKHFRGYSFDSLLQLSPVELHRISLEVTVSKQLFSVQFIENL